jgi:hypothetical protein
MPFTNPTLSDLLLDPDASFVSKNRDYNQHPVPDADLDLTGTTGPGTPDLFFEYMVFL